MLHQFLLRTSNTYVCILHDTDNINYVTINNRHSNLTMRTSVLYVHYTHVNFILLTQNVHYKVYYSFAVINFLRHSIPIPVVQIQYSSSCCGISYYIPVCGGSQKLQDWIT